jgi:hypothetical protein
MKTLNKILLTLGIVSLSSINLFSQENNSINKQELFDEYKTCVHPSFQNYQKTGEYKIILNRDFAEVFEEENGYRPVVFTRVLGLDLTGDRKINVGEFYEARLNKEGKIVPKGEHPFKYQFYLKGFDNSSEEIQMPLIYFDLKQNGLDCDEVREWDFKAYLKPHFNKRNEISDEAIRIRKIVYDNILNYKQVIE